MTGYTTSPPKAMPSLQEAQRVSLKEHIPFSYKKAIASLSNLARPLGTIITRESLKWSLRETLQKTKELKIQLRQVY